MATDTRTANRNYPQLVPANDLRDDATRLVVTFQMIDADVHALFAALAATAPADHGHGIAAIAGLQAALDARQSIDWRPALNDLTNVDTTGATNGQVLGRIGGVWAPLTLAIGNVGGLQAALDGRAATGHGHAIGDVTGLQSALDGKAASSFRPPLSELADVDLATAPPEPGDTLVFDGATWVPGGGGGVPAGVIAMWSGAADAIPAGWLLCDGSNGAPDLRDRFVVGAGGAYAVGATGGANSVTLTTAQIPAHSHTGSALAAGSHTHLIQGGPETNFGGTVSYSGSTSQSLGSTAAEGAHSHTLSIDNTGGGASHENRPPYYALCFIIKA